MANLRLKPIAKIGSYKVYPYQGAFLLADNWGMIHERNMPSKDAAINRAKHLLRAEAAATNEVRNGEYSG